MDGRERISGRDKLYEEEKNCRRGHHHHHPRNSTLKGDAVFAVRYTN